MEAGEEEGGADHWVLSGSDDDADDEAAVVASARTGGKRRPGRPAKLLGTGAFRRARNAAIKGLGIVMQIQAPVLANVVGNATQKVKQQVTDRLAALGTGVGNVMHKYVVDQVLGNCNDDEASMKDIEFVDHFMGAVPRPIVNKCAEALMLGIPSGKLGQRTEQLACALHFLSRSLVGSMISRILLDVTKKRLRPIATMIFDLYDETPLKLRAIEKQLQREQGQDAGSFKYGKTNTVSKLVQMELQIGILVADTSKQHSYQFLVLDLPCPIHMVDRGTSENICAVIDEEIANIPMLEDLRDVSKYNADACAADMASANSGDP